MKRNPKSLLAELAHQAALEGACLSRKRRDRPGAFIERLDPSQRETLRELRSEDVSDMCFIDVDLVLLESE